MPRYDFKTQRLFVDPALAAGVVIALERGQSNYLINVLRMKSGSDVLVFNGKDGEWQAKLAVEGRKSVSLELLSQTRPQPAPYALQYLFAPLKQARLDYMVQKAVEMGAGVLQPVLTDHTQVSKVNAHRMQTNAIEAAEQCGILSVPDCRAPQKLSALLENWNATHPIVFCDEGEESQNPLSALQAMTSPPSAILIGPEGGFSESERKKLRSLDFVTAIPLGPRVLRADTAAVAAMAVVQACVGDWH